MSLESLGTTALAVIALALFAVLAATVYFGWKWLKKWVNKQ